jgi:glycosyltransferase involved in cell wall biosynthesis
MNIFIIAYWHDARFKKKRGGLIRMFSLADNLKTLGNNVTLILPKLGSPKEQTVAQVVEIPFVDFPILRPISFHLLSSLFLLWSLKDASLIYVRQMNSFLPLLIARLYRTPSVFEIPNDPFLAYESSKLIRRIYEKLTDKAAMTLSNRIVVLSEWSKNRLGLIGGISPAKIVVTPSGTDTNLFRPLDKIKCCKDIGLDPSLSYIGFTGSFFEYQGVDVLIKSAPFILDKFPNSKFLLVGDGPMLHDWERQVDNYGLTHTFIFTGQVPLKEVPTYIGAMDICVAPHHSETNQASPVKLFDYMASGRPIVASDIEVVREIIADSGCATLVDPDNTEALSKGIIALLEDNKLRMDMSCRGRLYAVDKYDRKTLAIKLFDKVKEIKPI